jgi:hypothetical protein
VRSPDEQLTSTPTTCRGFSTPWGASFPTLSSISVRSWAPLSWRRSIRRISFSS